MLNHMKIRNFKAWRKAEIEFGNLTGFFGTNSAGKSSLLQLLLLLKQTKNATDRRLVLDFGSPSDLVNLGTFGDVVHGHNDDARIGWQLGWSRPTDLKVGIPTDSAAGLSLKGKSLRIRSDVGLRLGRLRPYELRYSLGEVDFSVKSQEESATRFKLETKNTYFKFRRNKGRPWPLSPPVKAYMFPDETRHFYQNANFLGDFELAYEKLMDSIYYLGPLREYPRRDYHWAGSSPDDVGQRGERTVDAILAATRDVEMRSLGFRKRKKIFQEMIAYWLRELGLINEFHLEEIAERTNLYQAIVRTSGSSASTALTDVGFGVSQVLPVLVLLYYVPERSIVMLEQPEIHLHPSVQSGLADVMLNVVKARQLQIIVESHSEHLLRRFQRRVAEEEASSKNVKLYFVSKEEDMAQAKDLSLNDWGEIENWPDGFFGDEMGEISAITEASLKRRLDQGQ